MVGIRNFDIGATPSRPQNRTRREERVQENLDDFYPNRRARENVIPTTDELAHLISRALTALSRGVYWDRGSIVNIVL
tara:strand:- start:4543 stop:4776 length:234 start_codon:yes stop_codon:yes gene_type:complete